MILAVLGDVPFRRLLRSGVQLLGARYDVEAFEEARLDAMCGRCSRWGHIQAKCPPTTTPRGGSCGEEHETREHMCSAEGCTARQGQTCKNITAECVNCRGPHFAQANVCPKKREARWEAKGWRSPSPQRRKREARVPEAREEESPSTLAMGEGEVEVEERSELTPEKMKE